MIKATITFAMLLLISSCLPEFRSSELPEQMPENTRFSYSENGGMLPEWSSIKIKDFEVIVEDKKSDEDAPSVTSAPITIEEKQAVYKIFRDNKFDLIENEEAEEITYDAGSESVYINAGKVSNNVSHGDNSPIPSSSLGRYQAARKAITSLAKSKESAMKPVEDRK